MLRTTFETSDYDNTTWLLSPLHCATTILTSGHAEQRTEFLVQRLPRKREKNDHPFQRFKIAKNYGIVKRINVGSKESASFPSNVQLSVLIKTGGIS